MFGDRTPASTLPEASKLPVIFLVMQRSAHTRSESKLQGCSPRTGPAPRLTGRHHKPTSAPCLLEQNSGKPAATATTLITTLSRGIRRVSGNGSVLGKQGQTRAATIRRECLFICFSNLHEEEYISPLFPSSCLQLPSHNRWMCGSLTSKDELTVNLQMLVR